MSANMFDESESASLLLIVLVNRLTSTLTHEQLVEIARIKPNISALNKLLGVEEEIEKRMIM